MINKKKKSIRKSKNKSPKMLELLLNKKLPMNLKEKIKEMILRAKKIRKALKNCQQIVSRMIVNFTTRLKLKRVLE